MAMASAQLSVGKQVQNFARHFFQMCFAMCLGGGVLDLAFLGGARALGYPDVRERSPELSLLVIATIYVLPMAAWMLWRGMPARPVWEMTAAGFAVAPLFIGLSSLQLIPTSTLTILSSPLFCGPACIAMFAVMLFRLDLYTGRGHEMVHVGGTARSQPV